MSDRQDEFTRTTDYLPRLIARKTSDVLKFVVSPGDGTSTEAGGTLDGTGALRNLLGAELKEQSNVTDGLSGTRW